MLTELRIENFAIIDRLELHFRPNLITFTGETGAGKSIIIDAVETILGGRADTTFIRSGSERASLEAIFRIPEANRGSTCRGPDVQPFPSGRGTRGHASRLCGI